MLSLPVRCLNSFNLTCLPVEWSIRVVDRFALDLCSLFKCLLSAKVSRYTDKEKG